MFILNCPLAKISLAHLYYYSLYYTDDLTKKVDFSPNNFCTFVAGSLTCETCTPTGRTGRSRPCCVRPRTKIGPSLPSCKSHCRATHGAGGRPLRTWRASAGWTASSTRWWWPTRTRVCWPTGLCPRAARELWTPTIWSYPTSSSWRPSSVPCSCSYHVLEWKNRMFYYFYYKCTIWYEL